MAASGIALDAPPPDGDDAVLELPSALVMRLGHIIRKYRIHQERTVRDLAKEIHISAPTLCRVEKGENVDGETLVKLITWILGNPIPSEWEEME